MAKTKEQENVVVDKKATTLQTEVQDAPAYIEVDTALQPKEVEMVKIKITYPKDWKAEKYFRDGEEIEMDSISAASTIESGIAKKV